MTEPITTTVETSEETVKAIRREIPVGVSGEAIQRVPYSVSLQRLLDSGATSHVIASTSRCIRVIELAVKGGGKAKFHCSRASVGVAGQQLCPEHDREAFAPSQTPTGPPPAIMNSNSVKLTPAELEDMGITEDFAPVGARDGSKSPPAPKPKPARPARASKKDRDSISLHLTLEDLAGKDLLPLLITLMNAALDNLPSGTIARMKRIMALQERLAHLGDSHD